MKLTKEYIGILYEEGTLMKNFYATQQKKITQENSEVIENPIVKLEYIMQSADYVKDICQPTPKGKIFYLSQNVQKHAELIKFEKINLDWFSNLDNELASFITNKKEFFRYKVYKGSRINIVRWFLDESGPQPMMKYESFAIKFPDNELVYFPGQDEESKKRFVKLLLFVKLSEPEYVFLKPNEKIKKDIGLIGKDNKLINESGKDVVLINTLWNKIVVSSGFRVRGHVRIQPFGPKNNPYYKLIWIDDFEKQGYIKSS